jgi:hypothetical protein
MARATACVPQASSAMMPMEDRNSRRKVCAAAVSPPLAEKFVKLWCETLTPDLAFAVGQLELRIETGHVDIRHVENLGALGRL